MSLWNIIRDFFVEYIFGGCTSDERFFQNFIGLSDFYINGEYDESTALDTTYGLFSFNAPNNIEVSLSVGDWLSTTATIITLCAICVFLFFFVRWLFRLTAGLVSGRG